MGILASGRDNNQMQFGESYEHSGNGFNGSNRYISSANPGAENRVDMHQMQGIPEDRHSNHGINPFQPRPSTPRLNDRERSYRDRREPHCPIRLAERGRGRSRSRSHENERSRSQDRSRGPSRERSYDRSRSHDRSRSRDRSQSRGVYPHPEKNGCRSSVRMCKRMPPARKPSRRRQG